MGGFKNFFLNGLTVPHVKKVTDMWATKLVPYVVNTLPKKPSLQIANTWQKPILINIGFNNFGFVLTDLLMKFDLKIKYF